MALDVKIFENQGGTLIPVTWPLPDIVEGEYALVQRIVKNLLTGLGEDQFDPDWGSGLADELRGIAGQEQARATRAAASALAKCQRDLLEAEQPPEPAGRLVALRLETIIYDLESTSWILSVDVETEERQLSISAGL